MQRSLSVVDSCTAFGELTCEATRQCSFMRTCSTNVTALVQMGSNSLPSALRPLGVWDSRELIVDTTPPTIELLWGDR